MPVGFVCHYDGPDLLAAQRHRAGDLEGTFGSSRFADRLSERLNSLEIVGVANRSVPGQFAQEVAPTLLGQAAVDQVGAFDSRAGFGEGLYVAQRGGQLACHCLEYGQVFGVEGARLPRLQVEHAQDFVAYDQRDGDF